MVLGFEDLNGALDMFGEMPEDVGLGLRRGLMRKRKAPAKRGKAVNTLHNTITAKPLSAASLPNGSYTFSAKGYNKEHSTGNTTSE
ncbi:hypothetical protein SO802_026562 [Lithocarpus litseifolius]|uniref:Uncharacterized protein n=1 Tax=Lithocarpus litseifolius TaxID=425828 RepID=A0AAW2C2J3_9ROSI